MNRMEEEADALGADGIVGVRLTVKLGTNPLKQQWDLYREWQDWARSVGFPRSSTLLGPNWNNWPRVAYDMWVPLLRAARLAAVPRRPGPARAR